MKPLSEKTKVVEYLFTSNWNAESCALIKTVMTMQDVVQAIQHCNTTYGSKLSKRNPANFMKDIVRGSRASANWPAALTQLGYTARQRTGTGDVFEFVPFAAGQTEPFPDLHVPNANTARHKIESTSLSLEARKLGRADEAWSIQTAVKLRIIETHFAIYSALPVEEVAHLQMSVKLRKAEIDGLFLARYRDSGNELISALVTCETKQARERLLEDQIIEQVRAVFGKTSVDLKIDVVVPIGLKVVRRVGFYVVEFAPVMRASASTLTSLTPASTALYELVPEVRGI